MNSLPPDWKIMLHKCNFLMARREIAAIFHVWKQQAEAEGKIAIWKNEIGDAWNLYAENPCYDTAVRFVIAFPIVFQFFSGCCPGGELCKTGFLTAMDFSIGGYSLESDPDDLQELRELSIQEYQFFPRVFRGEVIYHASPICFLGRKWQFMVSLVNGKIIKWAASLELVGNEINEFVPTAFQQCERLLGSPTEEKQGWFFWDTPNGNVILQVAQAAGLFDISIFATSREIRSLQKV